MDERQLKNLLKKMDIPSYRFDNFSFNNLTWLRKNLAKRNSNHPNFNQAFNEIKRKLEKKEYDN